MKDELHLTMCPTEDLRTVMERVQAGNITNQELLKTLECIVAVLDEEDAE